MGLSLEEVAKLSASELKDRCDTAAKQLRDAGADFILESAADLGPLIDQIDHRLQEGHRP